MSRLGSRIAAFAALLLLASGCGDDETSASLDSTTSITTSTSTTTEVPDSGGETSAGPEIERWPSPLAELDPSSPARWTVEIVATAPHDPAAFTQGLEELDDGRLLESTGRESDVRIVDPTSGAVERSVPLDGEQFGEGITVVGDTAIQLTWRDGIAPRWTLPALEPLQPFTYDGEGWGICLLGDRLAMTDGTSTLTWRDPQTFDIIERVEVQRDGVPLTQLNELECVDGHIIANIWRSPEIVVFRPDGAVVATVDGQELVALTDVANPTEDVLNGVAAHLDGTFSMTGKLWPTRYIVQVVPG